jgi:hypothetical protein
MFEHTGKHSPVQFKGTTQSPSKFQANVSPPRTGNIPRRCHEDLEQPPLGHEHFDSVWPHVNAASTINPLIMFNTTKIPLVILRRNM